MSAISLPQTWATQPTSYPPIDARFRRGLTLAYLGTEHKPIDRVSGRVGSLRGVTTNYTNGIGPLGRTINTYTGSGQGVQFNVKTETVSSCTLIIGISVTDTWNVFVGFEADNNTYIGGNGSGQFIIRQGGTDLTGGSISANTFNIIAVSFNGTTTRAYKNGIFQLSGTGGSTAFSSTWNFGGNAGGGGTSNPKIAFAYVWDRPLPDSELLELSKNPYLLFATIPRRTFFDASGTPGAYTLTANPGAYTLSGQTADLTRSKLLTANAGAYTLSGQTADLTWAASSAYTLTANPGAYTLAGQTADLTWASPGAYVLTANAGAYTLSGQTASLLKGKLLTASAGAYTLAGQSADLTKSAAAAYTLTANAGAYTLAGQGAVLTNSGEVIPAASSEPTIGISWGALVRKTWGKEWVEPEWDYQFSNGRRFKEKKNPYS